ncbi:MAG: hypothetical protein M1820_000606 [Bogoriella megaspora]|nr:MAG: hypothetical protein M1820_000606 [Bogoriella megaspora]
MNYFPRAPSSPVRSTCDSADKFKSRKLDQISTKSRPTIRALHTVENVTLPPDAEITKPPVVVGPALDIVKPPLVLELVALVGNVLELDVDVDVDAFEAVPTALIVPVHAAPTGQHATLPAISGEQTLLGWQQRPGAPTPKQFEYWSGQLVLLL